MAKLAIASSVADKEIFFGPIMEFTDSQVSLLPDSAKVKKMNDADIEISEVEFSNCKNGHTKFTEKALAKL